VWRPCGDRVATVWRPRGDRVATLWKLLDCLAFLNQAIISIPAVQPASGQMTDASDNPRFIEKNKKSMRELHLTSKPPKSIV
jgi:hypothetical protein